MQSEVVELKQEEISNALLGYMSHQGVPKDYEIDEGYFDTHYGQEFIFRLAFLRFNRRSPDKITNYEIEKIEDGYSVRIYYK